SRLAAWISTSRRKSSPGESSPSSRIPTEISSFCRPRADRSIRRGLDPRFLILDPAIGARVQQVERQHAAVQHLIVKAADVEFRTQLLLGAVAQFAKLEL